MFTNPPNRSPASAMASTICPAVWERPMARRTRSSMVWGLMEMRRMPWALRTSSFSPVMVSGRPASTVNSVHPSMGRDLSTAVKILWSWAALRVVGVPPPI